MNLKPRLLNVMKKQKNMSIIANLKSSMFLLLLQNKHAISTDENVP